MRLRLSVLSATAAVLCVVVLAACGSNNASDNTPVTVTKTVTTPLTTTSATTATGTGPQTDTTATKTSTTPGAVPTACAAADLTPSYLGSNGAAGTIVLGFALKNTGSRTCHTYGWPGVEFLSSSGAALPTGATRTTGDVVGSTPANVLALAPGEEASFRMVMSDVGPGGGNCPSASALQIYAPDDTVNMKVPLRGVVACGKGTVSPMLPGDSAFAGQGGSAGGAGGAGQAGIGTGTSAGSGQGASTTSSGGSGLSGSSA